MMMGLVWDPEQGGGMGSDSGDGQFDGMEGVGDTSEGGTGGVYLRSLGFSEYFWFRKYCRNFFDDFSLSNWSIRMVACAFCRWISRSIVQIVECIWLIVNKR